MAVSRVTGGEAPTCSGHVDIARGKVFNAVGGACVITLNSSNMVVVFFCIVGGVCVSVSVSVRCVCVCVCVCVVPHVFVPRFRHFTVGQSQQTR